MRGGRGGRSAPPWSRSTKRPSTAWSPTASDLTQDLSGVVDVRHGDRHGDNETRAAVRRLTMAVAVLLAVPLGLSLSGVVSANGDSFPAATPPATCGKGALPETGV